MNERTEIIIHYYDSISLLDQIRLANIPVYKFKILGDDDYLLTIDLYNEKRIKKVIKEVEVVKHYGLLGRIKRLFTTKITLISLLISMIFFFDITNRVSDVKVVGTNHTLSSRILDYSSELGLKEYIRLPKYEKLLEVETSLKNQFVSSIDFLEVRLKGTIITIKYQTRKDTITVPEKEGSKYASKNGIISHFVLSSGQKMVEENQYVTAGTLLVSDTITDTNGNEIKIGAYGQVYAKTWTIIEVKGQKINDKSEAFLCALQKSKELMCKGFYLEEKILEEKILKFDYKNGDYFLKIHFTCLEDIGN